MAWPTEWNGLRRATGAPSGSLRRTGVSRDALRGLRIPPASTTPCRPAVHHPSRVARPSVRRGWVENPGDRARDRRGDELVELGKRRSTSSPGRSTACGGSRQRRDIRRFLLLERCRALPPCAQPGPPLPRRGWQLRRSFPSCFTDCAQPIMPHVIGMNFLEFSHCEQTSWSQTSRKTGARVSRPYPADRLGPFGVLGAPSSHIISPMR
jgi:hypothetical protein